MLDAATPAAQARPAGGGRIAQLDLLRVTAMLAVLALHTSSAYIHSESGLSLFGMNLAFWLNQLTRFAVPLFILLSGVSLAAQPKPPVGRFISGRMKIVIHYVIWCMVYYIASLQGGAAPVPAASHAKWALLGWYSWHLYFVPLILQLYILYYPLRFLLERFPKATLGVCFAVTMYFILANHVDGWDTLLPEPIRPYAWQLFPTWLFYFALGLWMDRAKLGSLFDFSRRHLPPLCAVTLAFGVLCCFEAKLTGTYGSSIKPTLVVYTLLVFVTLSGAFTAVKSRWAVSAAKRVCAASFTVYLSHILILELLREIYLPGMRGMLALLLLTTALSIAFAFAYDRAFACLKR